MAQSIEQQIQHYLPLLGNEEKRSILGVIKSFINLKGKTVTDDYTDAFVQELDQRSEALESGSERGLSWEEIKQKTRI